MSVVCTELPGVVQVSFVYQPIGLAVHELFCYVRANEGGVLEILYSHTVTRSRPTDKGAYTEMPHRFQLDDQLKAVISGGVMLELFRVLAQTPEELPGDYGEPLSQVLAPAFQPFVQPRVS